MDLRLLKDFSLIVKIIQKIGCGSMSDDSFCLLFKKRFIYLFTSLKGRATKREAEAKKEISHLLFHSPDR